VLVLDEPSSGLDPIFQRVVLDLLIESATDGGTVLFSSHQIGQVERAADHVAILRAGKLVLHRDVESLKASEKIVEATFETAIPDLNGSFDIPAIRRVDRAGNMLRLSVREKEEDVARQLERFQPTSLRIVNRNLEDIFLDVVSEKQ